MKKMVVTAPLCLAAPAVAAQRLPHAEDRVMTMCALAVGLVLMWGTIGMGLELAHPVFFASEPVVVFTTLDASAPTLSWSGEDYEISWLFTQADGRMRWEGTLEEDAPLGAWTVCIDEGPCHSVLRVTDDSAVLTVQGPSGAEVSVGEKEAVLGAAGAAFFVLSPGDHDVRIVVPALPSPVGIRVSLRAGQRRELPLGRAELSVSSSMVLPGYAITVRSRVEAPEVPPFYVMRLEAPDGWEVRRALDILEPDATWEVRAPDDYVGEAELAVQVPALGLHSRATVSVQQRLPIEVVTSYWRVVENRLDLTVPGEITYDRLRWAASLLGQEMPHTELTVSHADLEELGRLWAEE